MAYYVIRVARQTGLIAVFVGTAIFGTISGVLFAFVGDLPQISALDDYAPSAITRVLAADGEVVAEFATQRRLVVAYEEIAPRLREAIVASEDASFNSHFGVSPVRVAVTAVRNILNQQRRGASTITMQLARNLFLTLDKTWERKIKELLLTFQIEKAVHEAGNPDDVRQSGALRAWGLRRRGRLAHVLRQVSARAAARGSRAARRHHPGACPPESVRQSRACDDPAQLRPEPDGSRRLHHGR